MKRVFVSSIQHDFEDVRRVVKETIESLGHLPVMAETTGASSDSSRDTLLNEVRHCDMLLLLLGPTYGIPGDSGRSPTEDEFDEAKRIGKPALVLVQDGDREPEQEAFLGRIRGNWDTGVYAPSFSGPEDVGPQVVKALRGLEECAAAGELAGPAQARVAELERWDEQPGTVGSGSIARLVAAPLVDRPLIDAVMLDDSGLVTDIENAVRECGLVTNAMGIETSVSGEGLHLTAKDPKAFETIQIRIDADGAIAADGPVGGTGGHFSGSVVLVDRLLDVAGRAARFCLATWERIDQHHDVRQVACALAIPDAAHKVFAEEEPEGTMSMAMNLPSFVSAPEPAMIVRREDLATDATLAALVAAIKRVFADHDAVHPR